MYIIEIILDGFKSYQSRTVIKDFDRQFNAITGLNGTGKSNVMDAILFVLGFSKDWELLRVSKPQELIYKGGHAGITKAEVSIVFDNRDKKNSPMGYEQFNDITVTRIISQDKSKFFINGTKETLQKVKNMFRSVQLNIDNPHFFVGQGRITKIINLKPTELINMLEETAGTALYNQKKKESLSLIEKKQEKLNEINNLIQQEIQPQMEKLKKEREQYFLWKSGENELQRMTKMLRAFEFYDKTSKHKERQKFLSRFKEEDDQKVAERKEIGRDIKKIEEELEKYINDKVPQNNEKLQNQIHKLQEMKTDLIKKESDYENRKKQIQDSEKEIQNLKRAELQNKNNIERIESKLEYERKEIESREEALRQKKEQLDDDKRNVENFKNGVTNIDSAKDQLNQQLQNSQNNLKKAQGEMSNIKMKIQRFENEIKRLGEDQNNNAQQNQNQQKELEILEREIKNLEQEIMNSNFNENELNMEVDKKRQMENDFMNLDHKINNFYKQQGNYIFRMNYRDPEPGFDRRRVRGKLFSLFHAKDEQFLRALEVGAGGKIMNIVVDNETVSKLLLTKRCFDYYVSFIPNSKIQYKELSQNVIQNAEQIARQLGGNVWLPNRIIDFNQELTPSIMFAFGGFLICSSIEIAKRIAFNPQFNFRCKCVTLDGDIHDPSGTLTGGYINQSSMTLEKAKELKNFNDEIDENRRCQREVTDKVDKLRSDQEYFQGLRSDLEQKKQRFEKKAQESRRFSGINIQERCEQYKSSLEDEKQNYQKKQELSKQLEEEIQNINGELKNLNNSQKQGNIGEIWEKKVKKLTQDVKNLEKDVKKSRDTVASLEVEKENCQNQIKNMEKKEEKEKKELEKNSVQISDDKYKLEQKRTEIAQKAKEIDEIQKKQLQVDQQKKDLESRLEENKKKAEGLDEEIKKLQAKLTKYNQDVKQLTEALNALQRQFEYINTDKDMFGVVGSEYDFTHFNYEQSQKQFEKNKSEQDKLQKKVNFKVEANIENVENRFKELCDKRKEVEGDKKDILDNMDELDKKKQLTLESCYLKVNETFGRIFSDLLHNAFAKISPMEGKSVSEGLELSVKLGGKWKTSLTELSGGQRTLLALSFILSLLQFKPAPFYILDEVDGALDLSHTENIGLMISQNFPQSQFIIISHKDGMFQNANVLFKMQNQDGSSKIDRIAIGNHNKKKKKINDNQIEQESNKENNKEIKMKK